MFCLVPTFIAFLKDIESPYEVCYVIHPSIIPTHPISSIPATLPISSILFISSIPSYPIHPFYIFL